MCNLTVECPSLGPLGPMPLLGDHETYVKLARMYVASARGSYSRVSDTSERREGKRQEERWGKREAAGRQEEKCE